VHYLVVARYDLFAISKTVLLLSQLLVMEIFPPPHKQVVYFVPFMHLQGEKFYFYTDFTCRFLTIEILSVLFVSIALSFLTERMVEQKEAMKKVANEFKTNEMMKSFVDEHRSSILSADVSTHTDDEDDGNAEKETIRKRIRLVLFLLLLVYSGGILLGQDNDWTFIDACYFTTITMTTIGKRVYNYHIMSDV